MNVRREDIQAQNLISQIATEGKNLANLSPSDRKIVKTAAEAISKGSVTSDQIAQLEKVKAKVDDGISIFSKISNKIQQASTKILGLGEHISKNEIKGIASDAEKFVKNEIVKDKCNELKKECVELKNQSTTLDQGRANKLISKINTTMSGLKNHYDIDSKVFNKMPEVQSLLTEMDELKRSSKGGG